MKRIIILLKIYYQRVASYIQVINFVILIYLLIKNLGIGMIFLLLIPVILVLVFIAGRLEVKYGFWKIENEEGHKHVPQIMDTLHNTEKILEILEKRK